MKLSRRTAPLLGLATLTALGLAAARPAQAQNFTFTFDGDIGSGSGSLSATSAAGPDEQSQTDYFQANSGSGTFSSGGFAGEVFTLVSNPTPGSDSYAPSGSTASSYVFRYDDELFPGASPTLDAPGLLFDFEDSGVDYQLNLFNNGSYHIDDYNTSTELESTGHGTFTLSPAPEPSSVAAFAFMGLGAAALMLRARKRRNA